MGLLRRHRWFVAAAGITLAFAGVCFISPRGAALTAFADLTGLVLMLVGFAVAVWNARSRPGKDRSFWVLVALGFLFWMSNQAAWTVLECVWHRPIPDPFL